MHSATQRAITIHHSSVEETCQRIFAELDVISSQHIFNQDLAIPLNGMNTMQEAKEEFSRRHARWQQKINQPLLRAAKYGFLLCLLLFVLAYELLNKRNNHALLLLLVMVGAPAGLLYQQLFSAVPGQAYGTFFLPKPQKEIVAAEYKYDKTCQQARSGRTLWRYYQPNLGQATSAMNNAILRGLFGLKNNSFDCIGISGLVILKLIEAQVPADIEWFKKPGDSIDGHSFVVVGRNQQVKSTHIQAWNDDCWLVDKWYNLCVSVRQIKEDPQFFLRYPLLDPSDKMVMTRVRGDNQLPGYRFYIDKLNEILAAQPGRACAQISYLDDLCPRL